MPTENEFRYFKVSFATLAAISATRKNIKAEDMRNMNFQRLVFCLPFIQSYMKVKVAQLCPTLCYPTDYTVHGILQARILEWVAFSFSRGSSQPRDRTQVSCIAGGFFTSWATREA